MTLESDIEEYLAALRAERGLSPNTLEAYRRDLAQYRTFLDEQGVEPDAAAIESWMGALHDRSLAASTISRKLAAVRGLHRFLVAEDLAEGDPTILIDSPKRPGRLPKALLVDQVLLLIESPAADTERGVRDRAVLEFLYATGCRVSELCALDVRDLDLEDRMALVTGKGNKQRFVPLGGAAVQAVRSWLPIRDQWNLRTDALFVSSRGNRLSRQAVWRLVRDAALEAGLSQEDVTPHVLRHSAATHMVEGGADLRSVQEMLGHARISTTQVYTRVTPDHLREVYISAHPRSK